jgi:hypothetical protein
MEVIMTIKKKVIDNFNYNNIKKTNKNFMYKDLRRSNCYNCDFTSSNFNFASLRGAQFKSCDFHECTFDSAEFVATNLKRSKFRKAKFENVVFDSANLEGVDFRGAEFKNVIFVSTDTSKAVNLDLSNADVKIFEEMPKLEVSEELENAAKAAMTNEYVKSARVLDTKSGEVSPISMMILLQNFNEKTLIRGLNIVKENVDKDFCTLSYIIKLISKYESEGLL